MEYICPICNVKLQLSEYLHNIFKDKPYSEWAANATCHYRHRHIRYYMRSCNSHAYAEKSGFNELGYDDFKKAVNNRAKRQIIRAIQRTTWDRAKKRALIEGFRDLQFNDKETTELIDKIAGRLSISKGYLRLEDFGVMI